MGIFKKSKEIHSRVYETVFLALKAEAKFEGKTISSHVAQILENHVGGGGEEWGAIVDKLVEIAVKSFTRKEISPVDAAKKLEGLLDLIERAFIEKYSHKL